MKILSDQMTISPQHTPGFQTPRSMQRRDEAGEKVAAQNF
jgi:hypothetical protein